MFHGLGAHVGHAQREGAPAEHRQVGDRHLDAAVARLREVVAHIPAGQRRGASSGQDVPPGPKEENEGAGRPPHAPRLQWGPVHGPQRRCEGPPLGRRGRTASRDSRGRRRAAPTPPRAARATRAPCSRAASRGACAPAAGGGGGRDGGGGQDGGAAGDGAARSGRRCSRGAAGGGDAGGGKRLRPGWRRWRPSRPPARTRSRLADRPAAVARGRAPARSSPAEGARVSRTAEEVVSVYSLWNGQTFAAATASWAYGVPGWGGGAARWRAGASHLVVLLLFE